MFQSWDIAPLLQKYKFLLHCPESLKRNDIEIFGSWIKDEHSY